MESSQGEAPQPLSEQEEAEIFRKLSESAIPLPSIDPREGSVDLQPLDGILKDAKVVGLGEATHGNKEIAQARHVVFKSLVEQYNFTGLVMEVPQVRAQDMNTFVRTGEGDPKEILKHIGYGHVFNTQEVLDMILWMREYNIAHPDAPLSFYGCDTIQADGETENERDLAMAKNTLKALEEQGEKGKLALWMHNNHIAKENVSPNTPGYIPTGATLKNRIGENYVTFGTIVHEGTVRATEIKDSYGEDDWKVLHNLPLAPGEVGTVDNLFAETNLDQAIFSTQRMMQIPHLAEWISEPHAERSVGYGHDPKHPEGRLQMHILKNRYDAIIWLKHVSPSTDLPNFWDEE